MTGRAVYFISHPDVVVSADVPVTQWPLSATGIGRMRDALAQPWVRTLSALYSSTETKAADAARILAAHRGLPWTAVAALGEIDRAATGFLPPPEFERVADAFFAQPEASVRGWERAVDAQRRRDRHRVARRGRRVALLRADRRAHRPPLRPAASGRRLLPRVSGRLAARLRVVAPDRRGRRMSRTPHCPHAMPQGTGAP